MMTLPTDEVPPPPSSRGGSTALVVMDDEPQSSNELAVASANQSDLELHLLQTFAVYASQQLVQSYLSVKHASRVTRYLADMTESLATRSGLVAVVRILFNQYMRLGHPFVQQVDDAMGKRVIDAVVSILMLAEQQPSGNKDNQTGILALEAEPSNNEDSDGLSAATKLSYTERFQALLLGEVPRLEQVLMDARREAEAEAKAKAEAEAEAPPPVVMELKDFVPVDEVARLKEESKDQLNQVTQETAHLRAQMTELTREKQRLEQRLTDVHNYQESERGRRFQDMEEELARTKLEANQKAHDLRKLELVVEALQRKHRKKSKSRKGDNQSNASESGPPSPVPEKKSKIYEGKRSSITA